VKISVLYVGTSLPGPLKDAERAIRSRNKIDLEIALHNCGDAISDSGWAAVHNDLAGSEIVFIIHVTNPDNAARIITALDRHSPRSGAPAGEPLESEPAALGTVYSGAVPVEAAGTSNLDLPGGGHQTVIAINCMPDLMRLTRIGKLEFAALMKPRAGSIESEAREGSAQSLARKLASWMSDSIRGRRSYGPGDERAHNPERKGGIGVTPARQSLTAQQAAHPREASRQAGGLHQYTSLIGRMPAVLKFLPTAGKLSDIKHYIYLFCYFLQPTPANVQSMILYAIKHYVEGNRRLRVPLPESPPATGIYHPDAAKLFESYDSYKNWYEKTRGYKLEPERTIGLLLMRPQIIGGSRAHYDRLIRAIEEEGLALLPVLSTFMDNRQASREFFKADVGRASSLSSSGAEAEVQSAFRARVSQIVSLTGFSFVGGPAMNDSRAAVEFLDELKVPLRSMVSLDIQTIESWESSKLGLNPVQTAMQIAIPEIDGATEPFIYGGLPQAGFKPEPIEDRCRRIARRLARWNRLQTLPRSEVKLALVLFCFPPNKGNVGTAAELDVFPSLIQILKRLQQEGYTVDVPAGADSLREMMLGGRVSGQRSVASGQWSGGGGQEAGDGGSTVGFAPATVAYRLPVDEYTRLCPSVREIEKEWGPAPGGLNSDGQSILIQGLRLGNAFIGVQPTFGYEGDPMRMLAAEGGAPHHGFMGFYTYIEKVFQADAVIHVGTHGALEFMPGKQAGLSSKCWPDRLIGELPNIYIYSVNNPSEGTIAKRRSYAELISYLTPPMENAGLYKGLASLKETILAYRQATEESDREQLYGAIEEQAKSLNLELV
jgi:magnesium chelatase subunit H